MLITFCGFKDLYKNNNKQSNLYPWDILFTKTIKIEDLKRIIDDENAETRVKILAYNKLLACGQVSNSKEILAVIVEVGLDGGLDVLASYNDGTARYINKTGKVIIWEKIDENSNVLTNKLFDESANIVKQIGPWENSRKSFPTIGNARITFLVSDGLYFGEGTIDVLFNDELAKSALITATELMIYIIKSTSTI